jgi:ubiquinone/menaquinone biosynthesis C-methylase UbiE
MNFADKKNIDFYEKIYNDGQNHQYPNLDLVRIHHTHLKKKLGKILDYGSGSGENSKFLAQNGHKVYSIDSSKSACKIIKKKNLELKKKQKMKIINIKNFKKLPFENDFFENIICISVLSLVGGKSNIKNLINEFIRVLMPGGLMLLDINGNKGDFATDKTKKITCLKSKKSFINLINKNFLKTIFIGEIYKDYSNISDHEYIMLLKKL